MADTDDLDANLGWPGLWGPQPSAWAATHVDELRSGILALLEMIFVREARADELRDSLFGNPAIRPERRHPWEAADG